MIKNRSCLFIIPILLISLAGCSTTAEQNHSSVPLSSTISQSNLSIYESLDSSGYAFNKIPFSNFSDASEKQLKPYLELAKKIPETYFMSVLSSREKFPPFQIEVSEPLKTYLTYKYAYDSTRYNRREKSSIKGTYELIKWEVVEDSLVCKVAVKIGYQDLGIDSGFGESIELVIDNPRHPVLSDWYNSSPGSFDSNMRGYGSDLFNKTKWLKNQDTTTIFKKCQKELDVLIS